MAITDTLKNIGTGAFRLTSGPIGATASVFNTLRKQGSAQKAASIGSPSPMFGPQQIPTVIPNISPTSDAFRSSQPLSFSQSPTRSTTNVGAPSTFPRTTSTAPLPSATQTTQQPSQPSNQGFTSTDPNIQSLIQTMLRQADSSGSMNLVDPNTAGDPQGVRDWLTEQGAKSFGSPSQGATPSTQTPIQGATPGAPVEAPFQTERDQISALRRALTESLQMSPEERGAQEQLRALITQQANLAASEQMGLSELSNQPIVLGIIRGQQQALQRQAQAGQAALGAQAAPLEMQLAQLQSQRQMAQQRAGMELGFAESDLERSMADRQAQEEARRKAEEPIKIGDDLVRFNPATGKYEAVYQSPSSIKPVTLGEGQRLVDPQTGAVIAENLRSQDPLQRQKAELEIMKLQRDLQQAGTSLSGQQIADALSKGYDTDAKIKLYAQMANQGTTPPPFGGADDPATSNLVRAATTVVRDANDALSRIDNSLLFKFGGTVTATSRIAASKVPGTKEYEIAKLIQSVQDNIGIDTLLNIKREGAGLGAVPQSQLETLQGVLGRLDIGRDPNLLKRDLNDVLTMYNGIIQKATQDSQGGMDDPLGIRFSNDLSTSVKGPLPKAQQQGTSMFGPSVVTAYGSPLWKHGLDIVLPGGQNAPIKLPISGTVISSGTNKGFGTQVRIRTSDGKEMWLSHLNASYVRPGQQIPPGTVIGLQGNTGSTIKSAGGTGTHIDITMPKSGGGYYTPQQVAQFIGLTTA